MPLFSSLVALFTILTSFASPQWRYTCASKTTDPKGTLTTTLRDGEWYVSVRQFCYAFGCRAFYQWANHKAVVQNPVERTGAILSSLTHVALVDGRVVDFKLPIISDLREGYLLPIELATKLAANLRLGRLDPIELEKPTNKSLANKGQFKLLVIDPGHGGTDMGTGFGSLFEKDVSVLYAMALRDQIKKEMPDVEVLLTRENDKYVSLPDRARLANEKGAHFFLSVHVNHAPNPKVEGAETYILNPEATDDEARKVALLENETWLKSSGIKENTDVVQKILVDMEQTKYIQNSALAASLIQQELGPLDGLHGLKNRGVKQAMFYVLSQVAMPSALVEMGFLSSTGDRGRLMNLAFRDEFVKRVTNALKLYRDQIGANGAAKP